MTNSQLASGTESSGTENGRMAAIAQGVGRRVRSPAWCGRAIAVALCLASIGFVVGFVLILGSGGQLVFVTRPLPFQVILVFPYLIALFTGGTAISAIAGWWHGYWSRLGRIHQTVLAVLGLALVWQLVALGFLP